MGKINGKQKGKAGELELAKKLREYGFSEARRSVQYNGKAEDGMCDIVGIPGYHIECKRVEKLNLSNAINQAIRDSEGTDDIPVVVHRKNREPWYVTISLDDFINLYKQAVPEKEPRNAKMCVCERCLNEIESREGKQIALAKHINEEDPCECDFCKEKIYDDICYII